MEDNNALYRREDMKKRLLTCAFALMILLGLTACGNNAKVSHASSDYIGSDYETTLAELQKAGFSSVEGIAINDLTLHGSVSDGSIEEISIDGTTDFAKNTSFPKDASIKITYHTLNLKDVPISSSEIQDYDYLDIEKLFLDAGFINVQSEIRADLDPDEHEEEFVNEIKIENEETFSKGDAHAVDSVVKIICHTTYEKYDIKVRVVCSQNLLFNKYDVKIVFDGNTEDTLSHGKANDYTFRAKSGNHDIEFVSAEDSSVFGKTELNSVESDIDVSYSLVCHGSEIEVKTNYFDRKVTLDSTQAKVANSAYIYRDMEYAKVLSALKKAGFKNITSNAIYDADNESIFSHHDGDVTEITIAGKKDFKKGEVFLKTDAVVITYHTLPENDPAVIAEKEAVEKAEKEQAALLEKLEAVCPLNSAQKASVVAMTNSQAPDVFAADGNSYDSKKFHSYGDLDGFYISVNQEGSWYAKNETTWRCDNVLYKINGYDTYMLASFDITFDGTNYIVSNVDKKVGTKAKILNANDDTYSTEHLEPSKDNLFLTVSPSMISSERDVNLQQQKDTAEQRHKDWVGNQFNIWDGSHKKLKELVISSLNDEKSFKHISTDYVEIYSEDIKQSVNEILKKAGYTQRVDIDDLFITMEFSAKNAYNATMKYNAYGVAYYSNNRVELIAIENAA